MPQDLLFMCVLLWHWLQYLLFRW